MGYKAYKEEFLHNWVSFQHGDSIRCVLECERKLDAFGNAKVTGHRVTIVVDKIEGSGEIRETSQGRKERLEKRHADDQFGLFDSENVGLVWRAPPILSTALNCGYFAWPVIPKLTAASASAAPTLLPQGEPVTRLPERMEGVRMC